MAVGFEINKMLEDDPIAEKIVGYLGVRKVATVYQIAEAIREKPADFERSLSVLQEHDVVQVRSDVAQKSSFYEPRYMLTGYGHEVAAEVARAKKIS